MMVMIQQMHRQMDHLQDRNIAPNPVQGRQQRIAEVFHNRLLIEDIKQIQCMNNSYCHGLFI